MLYGALGVDLKAASSRPNLLIELIDQHDREYVLSTIADLKKDSPLVDIEFRLFMPDQSKRWVRLKVGLLKDHLPGHQLLAGSLEDITKRKEQELSLFAIKEQKDVVLQILSHDLRAPINTITLATHILEQEMQNQENEKASMVLDIINTTCANSLRLISDVIRIEYIESQELEIFSAFAQRSNSMAKMLEDKQKKEALFSAILNDKELREDLMKRMMADKESSRMMMQSMMNESKEDSSMCNMMGHMMMQDGHMMDMMMSNMMDGAEKDPAMCKRMCSMMMDSDKMMNMMEDMKNNKAPAGTGGSDEKGHMQHHMDGKHGTKDKN